MTDKPERSFAEQARHTWRWIIAAIVVLCFVVVGAVFGISTRSRIDQEAEQRSKDNRAALLVGCRNVNSLAKAVKAIIASQGTVLAPAPASALGFEDPAVTRYVQSIIDRSQANAQRIHDQGDGIQLLDCARLSVDPPLHGGPVPTLPPSATTTTGSTGR